MAKEPKSLLAQLMHYCAYQERCHTEVRYKLVELGARGDELEHIMSELIAENFLNEERYACAFVRGKFYHKQWGKIKIIHALKQKEISTYCINKGLKEISSEDYFETVTQLVIKKFKDLQEFDNVWEIKQKTFRYLVQRGFEFEIIQEIVNDNMGIINGSKEQ